MVGTGERPGIHLTRKSRNTNDGPQKAGKYLQRQIHLSDQTSLLSKPFCCFQGKLRTVSHGILTSSQIIFFWSSMSHCFPGWMTAPPPKVPPSSTLAPSLQLLDAANCTFHFLKWPCPPSFFCPLSSPQPGQVTGRPNFWVTPQSNFPPNWAWCHPLLPCVCMASFAHLHLLHASLLIWILLLGWNLLQNRNLDFHF